MSRPYATTRSNEEVRERSGNEDSRSRLVVFLYMLLRDRLSAKDVESLATAAVGACGLDGVCSLTNGYLARYAKDLALALDPPDCIDAMEPQLAAGFVQAEPEGGVPLSPPQRKEQDDDASGKQRAGWTPVPVK